jgi:hypothetical protein
MDELEAKIKRIIDWLVDDIAEAEKYMKDYDDEFVYYSKWYGIKVQAELDLKRVRELLR